MVPSHFILQFTNFLNDRPPLLYLRIQELFCLIRGIQLFHLQWQGMASTMQIINHWCDNYGPPFNDCFITSIVRKMELLARERVSTHENLCDGGDSLPLVWRYRESVPWLISWIVRWIRRWESHIQGVGQNQCLLGARGIKFVLCCFRFNRLILSRRISFLVVMIFLDSIIEIEKQGNSPGRTHASVRFVLSTTRLLKGLWVE